MKVNLYRTLTALCFLFSTFQVFAQVPTANESVQPYTANFGYGSNMGGYGNGWTDKNLAIIVNKAGGNSLRPTLPDHFVERWGYNIRLSEFQYYTNTLGMKEITCFIEGPSEAHRDQTIYPGCTTPSKVFANLYEPIWKSDGTVNPNNYYANYVYKLVQTYGAYIKNWEVVNEPDLGANNPSEWLTRAPLPSEMSNLRAPFFNYVRMLRITWEVVKKYNPDDFVTPGGIGHNNFLDALLRYTDNPSGGAVTSQYPKKGGAYFDMVSYHVYPSFFLRKWDNSISGFKYLRNSDYAAAQVIGHKNGLEAVLLKHGYNGVTYPKKHFIVTETNISRRAVDWRYSSDNMQRNFGIKTLVLAQKNGIKQVHFFSVGETYDSPTSETISSSMEYGLMGIHENLKRDAMGAEKLSPLGKGFKTTSLLLQGYTYDASRTAALNLPAGVEGGAFKKNTEYVYVLWAKNPNDKSETYTQPYSFPAGLNLASVTRFEWDYSITGKSAQQASTGLTLNTAPSFFKGVTGTSTAKQSQTITFNALGTKVYGTAPFALQATASSGLPVSFKVVSGPGTLSGSTLTLTGAGTITIEATQAGNTSYNAATAVRQNLVVSKATPVITFGTLTTKTVGSAAFELKATSTNTATPVTFTSSNPGVVSVSNASGKWMATVVAAGTANITASQVASTNYLAAANVVRSQVVSTSSTSNNEILPVTTTKIEAEKYTSMNGVYISGCKDVGYGYHVGRIDANDWMKYSVNISASGTYTMNFRVSGTSNGQLEVRNGSGAVLKTVDIPMTGDWQIWKTVSASVPLTAGSQTLQIYVKKAGWNFNWFEIVSSSTLLQTAPETFGTELAANSLWTVFPNPATDKLQVRLGDQVTGEVVLDLLDASGRLVKRLTVNKDAQAGESTHTIPLDNVAHGLYFLHLKGKGLNEVKKVLKQ
ncbi:carbohydrate-binding protein [Rufibacter psychrotolerans]|uniref:carbohydrate-binding protein n=1 Tax=Rufibacter psychrotolerans TaxID=2812556 RepID=UPI0019677C58|nr:carbohydrate-binding protein [Rufibacter sp. SYSU D00308]